MTNLFSPRSRINLFPTNDNMGVQCNPWRDPVRCPLILYIVLIVVGVFINLAAVARAPDVDRQGRPLTQTQKWSSTIIGLLIYLIIAYLFGMWMYRLCTSCNTVGSWLIFLLAVFFPVILAFIFNVIVSAVLGVGFLLLRQ